MHFVELQGFEPWTPALQRQCSSQLSYSPLQHSFKGFAPTAPSEINIRHSAFCDLHVGLGGVEPPTSRLSGVRSNHLSYKPNS